MRAFVLTLSLFLCLFATSCSNWFSPQTVSSPPQTPLTAEESLNLWHNNCVNYTKMGCVLVEVRSTTAGMPAENVIVMIEGPNGMAGRTNRDGQYRWSRIAKGRIIVSITVLDENDLVKLNEEQEVLIESGKISVLRFEIP